MFDPKSYKPPFPWFGGKSRIAHEVWRVLGNPPNYVEPFFGSGANLFLRPHKDIGLETVNDFDGFVANFWRACKADPEALAEHADWPVNENDLHARHAWLVGQKESLRAKLEGDPEFFDAKVAGWWVWGICCWIGGGFCSGKGPWSVEGGQLVHLGDAGRGVKRQLVHLGSAGQGVNRQLVHLGDAGRGVNRQLVHLGQYFSAIADRLCNVRVCCGDWKRVCGKATTTQHGLTGVFLDPPYSHKVRDDDIYLCDQDVAEEVRAWCAENGSNPLLRIALCGYEGEGHESLEALGWSAIAWKAAGGYGSQGDGAGRENSKKERIWCSPACLTEPGLFD